MPGELRDLIEGVYSESAEKIPSSLEAASREAEGQANACASLGQYNALSFENGYKRKSGEWSEEIDVPTRLGEKTHIVYLARLSNEKLVPFEDGNFPWDQSSIRMSKRKLKNISPEIEKRFRYQLSELVEHEKRISKYAIILPMFDNQGNGWVSQGIDGNEKVVGVGYDSSKGLMVGDEVEDG